MLTGEEAFEDRLLGFRFGLALVVILASLAHVKATVLEIRDKGTIAIRSRQHRSLGVIIAWRSPRYYDLYTIIDLILHVRPLIAIVHQYAHTVFGAAFQLITPL